MTLSFLPKNAFPLPAPLAPTLVALGLDNKTAADLSKVYFSSALTLKATCEAECIRACTALLVASDERGYSSKELRSKLLTVAVARYSQALSKWEKGARERAEGNLLQRGRKIVPKPKVKGFTTSPSKPSSKESLRPPSREKDTNAIVAKAIPFDTNSPPHAFPQSYPPPVRPEPVSFMTHIPPFEGTYKSEHRVISDSDLDSCITALSRLSLGSPPQNRSPRKPSKAVPKPRSLTHTTVNLRLVSRLSPSSPRPVSPILDVSVAVSHKPLPKHIPSHASPASVPRTQNINIPCSNRRKVYPIPYQRPTIHPSTSPESPLFSSSRGIRRTPSLVSDHGSEASSPSTPPDFPSVPTPTSTLAHEDFLEMMSPLEHSPVRHSEWHSIDFGVDIYG